MHTILYTAEEIPEAPMCARQNRGCHRITLVRWSGGRGTRTFWYEPCEDHQPKENND